MSEDDLKAIRSDIRISRVFTYLVGTVLMLKMGDNGNITRFLFLVAIWNLYSSIFVRF